MNHSAITVYTCSNNAIAAIKRNGECYIQGFGGSMEPVLHSGDILHFLSITEETRLFEGDIVFCEVNGGLLLHKIIAINGDKIQIGNNKGKMNGWTTRKHIFGRHVEKIDLQKDYGKDEKFGQVFG